MPTIIRFLAAVLLLLPGSTTAQQQLPLIHTDSVGAYRTEAGYRFHCGRIQTRLSFIEHFRDEAKGVPLADLWRLELTTLSVKGRRIPPADLVRVKALFHTLSWITRIQGSCGGNGDAEILLWGMPAQVWADFVEREGPQTRPTPDPYSIRISVTGAVTIR